MRHAVIGTAGHVDHGKTALVQALTGVQTDRLPEEQRRGITIELGFAPWRIADDLLVSVIDAPGHRRLVHNMIAGASGIDVVMLVVAADEGVMPQTREHVAACKLLGVRRAVVAVSKIDRADPELGELAGEEARELLAAHGVEAEVVTCSAKSGEGIAEVRKAVLAAVKGVDRSRARRRMRMGVDRVFTVHGAGTVVTGTLVEGEVAIGAALRVLGPDRELAATVRGLHVHGEACRRAKAPTRLAINLGGVAVADVERGMVVTDDPSALPTQMLDVWLDTVEPLKRGSNASIFIGTARSTARIQPISGEEELSGGGLARLRLSLPIVALGGDRFVLRGANIGGPAGGVCGGGVVLDAHPPRTVRASKRVRLLEALHRGDARDAMEALAEERAPRAIEVRALEARFAVEAAKLGQAAAELSRERRLYEIATGDSWTTRAAIDAIAARALLLVRSHHEQAPLDPGLEIQTLRSQLADHADEVTAGAAIAELTGGRSPKLVLEGHVARLASFGGASSGSNAAKALESCAAALKTAGLEGMSESELVAAGVGSSYLRAALAALERRGSAVHAGKLWFDAGAVDDLARRISEHFASAEMLTIADFKTMTGLARKQTIPLLEHFDRLRITRRSGTSGDRLPGGASLRR